MNTQNTIAILVVSITASHGAPVATAVEKIWKTPSPPPPPAPPPPASPAVGDDSSDASSDDSNGASGSTSSKVNHPIITGSGSSGQIKGFWYAPFSSGGSGGMCTPSSSNLELAPGSDSYDMSSFFWGLTATQWCTGSSSSGTAYLDYITSGSNPQLKFPSSVGTDATNGVQITNSFAGQQDDFTYKLFTIGGGDENMPWTADDISYLTSGCGASGSGLTDLLQQAGYNGIMLDYEYEDSSAATALKEMIQGFKSSYPQMTLSFTTQGNPNAGGAATTSLISTLGSTDGWDFVVPQIYDGDSCTYDDSVISATAQAFNGNVPSDKVLLGMVQGVPVGSAGCDSCTEINNNGVVEYFYRPQSYTQ